MLREGRRKKQITAVCAGSAHKGMLFAKITVANGGMALVIYFDLHSFRGFLDVHTW